MDKGRLEAFSDGVIAIIITIMVLELKVPHGSDLAALEPYGALFASYLVSFVYVGIYWNNHHHLMHAAEKVDGLVMWMNLHLLFWLSLIPVVTGWVGEHWDASVPSALYGLVLLCAGVAWLLLQHALVRLHGPESALKAALGSDFKGKISAALYLCAIGLAFVHAWIAQAIYVGVSIIWFIPDRRMERVARRRAEPS